MCVVFKSTATYECADKVDDAHNWQMECFDMLDPNQVGLHVIAV